MTLAPRTLVGVSLVLSLAGCTGRAGFKARPAERRPPPSAKSDPVLDPMLARAQKRMDEGDADGAEKLAKEVLRQARLVADPVRMAKSHRLLARVADSRAEPRQMVLHLEETVKLTRQVHGLRHDTLKELYFDLFRGYRTLKDGDSAVKWAKAHHAFVVATQGARSRASADAEFIVGKAYIDFKRFPEAVASFERAKAIELERKVRTSALYFWLSRALAGTKKYGRALEEVDTAIEYANPKHPLIAAFHAHKGFMHIGLGQLMPALVAHKEALNLYRQRHGNDHLLTAQGHINVGLVHDKRNEGQQARQHAQSAVDIFERLNDRGHMLGVALNNLGHAHELLGDHAEALATYRRSLAISDGRRGSEMLAKRTREHVADLCKAGHQPACGKMTAPPVPAPPPNAPPPPPANPKCRAAAEHQASVLMRGTPSAAPGLASSLARLCEKERWSNRRIACVLLGASATDFASCAAGNAVPPAPPPPLPPPVSPRPAPPRPVAPAPAATPVPKCRGTKKWIRGKCRYPN